MRQLYSDKDTWLMRPDLESIWDNIFMEYSELSQDKQGTHVFALIKEIHVLSKKIELIQLCIDLLYKCYDISKFGETIKTLKSLTGVSYKFTEETLLNDLKNTSNVAKKFIIQYEEVMHEYKEIAGKEQAKASEMDFMEEIAFVKSANGVGVSFDISKLTVMEYIAFVKQLKSKANG